MGHTHRVTTNVATPRGQCTADCPRTGSLLDSRYSAATSGSYLLLAVRIRERHAPLRVPIIRLSDSNSNSKQQIANASSYRPAAVVYSATFDSSGTTLRIGTIRPVYLAFMIRSSTLVLLVFASILASGCADSAGSPPSSAERAAIADSLKRLVTSTYDLSKPNAVARLMSLYPAEGPVI